jgi:hypothetical protein
MGVIVPRDLHLHLHLLFAFLSFHIPMKSDDEIYLSLHDVGYYTVHWEETRGIMKLYLSTLLLYYNIIISFCQAQ